MGSRDERVTTVCITGEGGPGGDARLMSGVADNDTGRGTL
jgi:hypothetical protein